MLRYSKQVIVQKYIYYILLFLSFDYDNNNTLLHDRKLWIFTRKCFYYFDIFIMYMYLYTDL